MASPTIANQDRAILRDCTLFTLASLSSNGSVGTPVAFLGIAETIEFSFKREFADTTAAADTGMSSRAIRWGKGSVKMTGFSAGTYSALATAFASSGHIIMSFTERNGGDSYQAVCCVDDWSASMGKEANKQTITMSTENTPYLNGTAMVLEG